MKLKLIMTALFLGSAMASSAGPALYDIPLKTITGEATSLRAYEGKVLLIVNVASKCGLTPQYAALEDLFKKDSSRGLVVLGFPCNDFASQEPGSNEEIQAFCSGTYGVTFPLFDKLHVKGAEQHPLYAVLTGKDAAFPGEIQWNFGKFLVDRQGRVIQRFEPKTKPDDPALVAAIEAALGK